jgi:ABC-type transport system involved in Fe-S cluster assembly fused permease/ATPase subunit
MSKLKATYEMLNSTDAVVTTQREMVRYTEEKNNYTTNQITVWTALNVLALGTIFYVYRN